MNKCTFFNSHRHAMDRVLPCCPWIPINVWTDIRNISTTPMGPCRIFVACLPLHVTVNISTASWSSAAKKIYQQLWRGKKVQIMVIIAFLGPISPADLSLYQLAESGWSLHVSWDEKMILLKSKDARHWMHVPVKRACWNLEANYILELNGLHEQEPRWG